LKCQQTRSGTIKITAVIEKAIRRHTRIKLMFYESSINGGESKPEGE
jgi:hypothetical protein